MVRWSRVTIICLLFCVLASLGIHAESSNEGFVITYTHSSTFFDKTVDCALRIYMWERNRIRIEAETANGFQLNDGPVRIQKRYSIYLLDIDKKVFRILDALHGAYVETAFTDRSMIPFLSVCLFPENDVAEKIGCEKILGMDCDIYRIDQYKMSCWVTTLQGLRVALKYEQGEGPNKTTFAATSIDFNLPSEELFRSPARYRRAFVVEPVVCIEDRYIRLGDNFRYDSLYFDKKNLTVHRDDRGGYVDLRLRIDETRDTLTDKRKQAGLSVAGFDRYLYTLTHLQLAMAGQYRILGETYHAGDGTVISSDESAGDWHDITPNSLMGYVFDEIMPFIEANMDNLQMNLP